MQCLSAQVPSPCPLPYKGDHGCQKSRGWWVWHTPELTPLSPGLVFRCLRFVSVTQAAKASLGGCGATAVRAALGRAGEERCREQPGLLCCTELDTPLRGSGELREQAGGRETFKGLLYPNRIGGELLREYHGLRSCLSLPASALCA